MTGTVVVDVPQLRIMSRATRAPSASSTSPNPIASFSPGRHVKAPRPPPTLVTRCGDVLGSGRGRGVYLGVAVIEEVGTTASGTAGIGREQPDAIAVAAIAAATARRLLTRATAMPVRKVDKRVPMMPMRNGRPSFTRSAVASLR